MYVPKNSSPPSSAFTIPALFSLFVSQSTSRIIASLGSIYIVFNHYIKVDKRIYVLLALSDILLAIILPSRWLSMAALFSLIIAGIACVNREVLAILQLFGKKRLNLARQ